MTFTYLLQSSMPQFSLMPDCHVIFEYRLSLFGSSEKYVSYLYDLDALYALQSRA